MAPGGGDRIDLVHQLVEGLAVGAVDHDPRQAGVIERGDHRGVHGFHELFHARSVATYPEPVDIVAPALQPNETQTSAYVVAHLRSVQLGSELVEYISHIDDTLAPFEGRFLIHGGPPAAAPEGDWPGELIVIAFPDRRHATAWYSSDAFQEIVALRTGNSDGVAVIFDEVEAGHRATDILQRQEP